MASATRAPAPANRSATPVDVDVGAAERAMRGWSDALRGSDVAGATDYFALPALITQGTSRRLRTRAEVSAFNAALPCGARLRSVRREGRYVIGTFRLGDRPGHRCDAPGAAARVAVVVKDGKLVEWRQLPTPAPDDPSAPDAPDLPPAAGQAA